VSSQACPSFGAVSGQDEDAAGAQFHVELLVQLVPEHAAQLHASPLSQMQKSPAGSHTLPITGSGATSV
jgi:hypothetical protein